MKFECGDLEKALANPGLLPEAHAHLEECAACRAEYRMWNDISSAAKELHREWESPKLWPKILTAIQSDRQPAKRWWTDWKPYALAAAAALLIVAMAPW